MIKLLLIADDLTGALDTGIQFAKNGITTRVLTSLKLKDDIWKDETIEVLVIDTETRHLSEKEAYTRIYRLTKRAMEAGISHIYKKTDSGLRGNIGSELSAVLDASGEKFLPFIPALPAMKRITVNGIHYIDGIPVQKSEFGKDPFEPVTSSNVTDLFQQEKKVILLRKTDCYKTDLDQPSIGIFDASEEEDIFHIADHLKKNNQLRIMAGCAGFASVLPSFLSIGKHEIQFPILKKPLLVACGSVNPISRRQIEYGEKIGYTRITMTPEQQLKEKYLCSEEGERWIDTISKYLKDNHVVMMDTDISGSGTVEEYCRQHDISLEDARVCISNRLGEILAMLFEKNKYGTLMIIGGDTLMSFIKQTDCREIEPMWELEPGTVLSSLHVRNRALWVITKSGGFGKRDLLEMVADKIGT